MIVLYFCFTVFTANIAPVDGHDLYIGGLLAFEGSWPGGQSLLTGAEIAMDDINRRDDILPGYNLHMIWNDSKCDRGTAVSELFHHLHSGPTKIAIFGASCSPVSQIVARTAPHWGLVQMSSTSSSPSLSDRNQYPLFFRTQPSTIDVNKGRIELFKRFGWRKISTIHQSEELFSLMIDDLIVRLKEEGMIILRSEIFNDDPATQVASLKSHDARVIVGEMYSDRARNVLCQAYKTGYYGPKIVWIFTGWYENGWWNFPDSFSVCTAEEIKMVAEGYFAPGLMYINPVEERGIAGVTQSEFDTLFLNYNNNVSQFGQMYGGQSYDGIWAIALALNITLTQFISEGSTMRLENFTYSDSNMSQRIFNSFLSVDFIGVSGPTSFSATGDTKSLVQIVRLQDSEFASLGTYDPNAGRGIQWSTLPTWAGNKIPRDSVEISSRTEVVPLELYITMCFFSGLGILLAIAFVVFNTINRHTRVIKMSSPKLNYVILAGCILTYTSVFFQDVTHEQGSIFCKLYTGFLTMGFSMAFGALFAKTWRVHVIFMTKLTTKRKILKDSHLLFMVFGIAAIQIVILVVWDLLDSQIILSRALPDLVFNDGEVIVRRSLFRCASDYSYEFRGAIYLVQGCLLIFGAFLAWETRTVKIAALNDSKYIGVSIYNVVILSVFSVGASFVLESQVTLDFAVISTCTILGTTITQCVIFIPKVISDKEQQIFPTLDGMTMQTMNTFHEPNLADQLKEKQARIQYLEQQLSLYANKDSKSEQQKA